MIQTGNLFAKYSSSKSFHGYDPKVLKNGIQKYGRWTEMEKSLWCLVEMDLFSLLEWDSPELKAYRAKYTVAEKTKTQRTALKIRN